jgi:hypothetical protein
MDLNMGNSKPGGREGKIAIAGAILIVVVAIVAAYFERKTVDNVELSTTAGQTLPAVTEKKRLNPTGPFMTLPERAQQAHQIVSGRVTKASSMHETNSFGDKLIVTKATIAVDETLKGSKVSTVEFTMLGGTVGDITMRASHVDEPLKPGETAVVFLQNSNGQNRVPNGEGNVMRLSTTGEFLDNHDKVGTMDQLRAKINSVQ